MKKLYVKYFYIMCFTQVTLLTIFSLGLVQSDLCKFKSVITQSIKLKVLLIISIIFR